MSVNYWGLQTEWTTSDISRTLLRELCWVTLHWIKRFEIALWRVE